MTYDTIIALLFALIMGIWAVCEKWKRITAEDKIQRLMNGLEEMLEELRRR